jgi:formyl-CoA transferase
MNALSGVLAALIERGRTGKGLYLEVALLDTAVGFMTYLAQNFWRTGIGPKRMGTGHPALAPYQAFESSDGPLMIGVGNDGQWRRFCELTGLQQYVDDPTFATNASRVQNFSKTVALVQARIVLNTRQYWLELLRKAGIPCSPINSLPEALNHPQIKERELIVSTEHPVLGTLQNVGLPVRFNGEKREAQCPPPLLGQHTGEIMHALGYSNEIIADYAKRGVIGLTA